MVSVCVNGTIFGIYIYIYISILRVSNMSSLRGMVAHDTIRFILLPTLPKSGAILMPFGWVVTGDGLFGLRFMVRELHFGKNELLIAGSNL